MNVELYAFANIRNEYSQYPIDFTQRIFRKFIELSTTSSQIVIHRNQGIVYYGYVRRVDNGLSYVGFCVVVNGAVFTCTRKMFSIFADALTNMATKHNLFGFHEGGDLAPLFDKFDDKQENMDLVLGGIKQQIDAQVEKGDLADIPHETAANASDECRVLKVDDKSVDMVEAVRTLGYVCVTEDKHYVSPFLARYQKRIEDYQDKYRDLNSQYDRLREKYERQDRQNKTWRIVTCTLKILFVTTVIIACLFGILLAIGFLAYVLEDHSDLIPLSNFGIIVAAVAFIVLAITCISHFISYKNYVPVITDVKIGNVYDDGRIETKYGDRIDSSNTMYLTPLVTYQGARARDKARIHIKLFTPSGRMSVGTSSPKGFTTYSDISVSEEENTVALSGWGNKKKGHWGRGNYRMEFWYGGVCIYSKKFSIE